MSAVIRQRLVSRYIPLGLSRNARVVMGGSSSSINSSVSSNGSLLAAAAAQPRWQASANAVRSMVVVVTNTKASMETPPPQAPATNSNVNLAAIQNTTDNPSILVTDSCWKRVHHLIASKRQTNSNNDDMFLRVFVDAGGCSGFTYQFEMDTDANLDESEDVVFYESSNGSSTTTTSFTPARVVIDRGSLQLIVGSKIDYVQEMIKSSFEVRENPQSESACGCGSSFALKNFASNPALD
jgi:iron-sulfur cluster assembly 2